MIRRPPRSTRTTPLFPSTPLFRSMMNLGDVARKTVPKMTMVSAPAAGGAISTRTFIPHKCHDAIGVLGAVSVATACLLPEGPATEIAVIAGGEKQLLSIEHPTGEMSVVATVRDGVVETAGVLRTARKLFDGLVFADRSEERRVGKVCVGTCRSRWSP